MRSIIVFSVLQFSNLLNGASLAADCAGLGGVALFSLKAVAVNGAPVSPANSINAMPGDVIDAEIFVSCWGSALDDVLTFQAAVLMRDGATSGTTGLILPQGWDAPIIKENCPCDDPRYPTCHPLYGCVGNQHNADLGATLDVQRPDYLLAGFPQFSAVDVASLLYFRFGGTINGPSGVVDVGQVGYIGTLHLVVQDDACGDFSFQFLLQPIPKSPNVPCNQTFLCDSPQIFQCICPALEPLTIHVCGDDDLFCNGLAACDAELGCALSAPPSCDDGVACTIDSCDETIDGCAHAPNHAACDDGDVCTRDECTPAECVNIDDQCGDIPVASTWGLAVLALCLLITAKLRFRPQLA